MDTWREVKDERIKIVGKKCEECGESLPYEEILGHHIIPRAIVKKYRLFLVAFCRLRCESCERKMHSLYPTGNSPETTAYLKGMLSEMERGVKYGYSGNHTQGKSD